MEAERILGAIEIIRADFEDRQILKSLTALNGAMQQVVANPADAPLQDALSQALTQFDTAVAKSKSNAVPISIRKTLKRIDAAPLIGETLKAEVSSIIEARPFLLPVAAQKLAKLVDGVAKRFERVKTAAQSLKAIGVSATSIDGDQYEIGISLPTHIIHNDLREIQSNVADWIWVLDSLSELIHGKKSETLPIRGVGTGSFEIFLSMDLDGAAAVLLVVGAMVKIFSGSKKRSLRVTEMAEEGYPSATIDQVTKDNETIIETKIDEIGQSIAKRASPKLDEPRRNELIAIVNKCIRFIFRSINRGVDVEVSTPPNPPANSDPEETKRIQAIAIEIETLRLEVNQAVARLGARTEPILQLPKSIEEDEPKLG
ncbi:MAG: hypothetical protein AMXMBFR47_00330 [Planctomycetota bacterium]